jgi:hypothetical protein
MAGSSAVYLAVNSVASMAAWTEILKVVHLVVKKAV